MSLDSLLSTNTVTIITPGTGTNAYRDSRPNWETPASEVETTGWLTQVNTSEQVGPREVVTSGWALYLHSDETITAACRVEVEGITYDVDGEPHHAQTPRGAHHIECVLRKVKP